MFLTSVLNLSVRTKFCHTEDMFYFMSSRTFQGNLNSLIVRQVLLHSLWIMTASDDFRKMPIISHVEKCFFQAHLKFRKMGCTSLMSVKVFATYVSSFRIPRKWRNVEHCTPRRRKRCDGRKTAILLAAIFPFLLMPLSSWRPLLLIQLCVTQKSVTWPQAYW